MSLSNIVSSMFGGNIIKDVKDLSDVFVTTDEDERKKIEITRKFDLEDEKVANQAVTDRWKFDMQFGNNLSKSIRPLVLAFWTILVSFIIILDNNIGFTWNGKWHYFTIAKVYVPYIFNIYGVIIGAYFIGRSYEKTKGASTQGY